jgi:hypothetical protein
VNRSLIQEFLTVYLSPSLAPLFASSFHLRNYRLLVSSCVVSVRVILKQIYPKSSNKC